ncbi:hypothetical protein EYS14_22110 [Alteromonadaceae bacterium M269]|nr:hypothetical protein EYS14_22110 [Alteromonadaceae bacterium M269]
MNLSIQLTLDYELFGDGTGDVYREQIIPTNHLMDICELYGAKLTVYFEYGQYLAFDKYSGLNDYFKSANQAILEQLKQLVSRGHDVQFHLHPTWLDASYTEEKGFILNKNLYDITFLAEDSIVEILRDGKGFLERNLKPIKPDYRCLSFRAGAWSARDSRKLISALLKAGYRIDSTVAKGAHLKSGYGSFDFRKASDRPYWYAKEDICKESIDKDSILELPILTRRTKVAPLFYMSSKRVFVNSIVSYYYKNKVTDQGEGALNKIKKLLSRDYALADFNFMPGKTLLKMIEKEINSINSGEEIYPITLIGHSKTSYNNDDLHLFFRALEKIYSVSYDTVSSYYMKYIEK